VAAWVALVAVLVMVKVEHHPNKLCNPFPSWSLHW
jgi:hypothetical protein